MEVFCQKVKGKRGESLLGVFSLNDVKLKKDVQNKGATYIGGKDGDGNLKS
jgi:hypothetical protein